MSPQEHDPTPAAYAVNSSDKYPHIQLSLEITLIEVEICCVFAKDFIPFCVIRTSTVPTTDLSTPQWNPPKTWTTAEPMMASPD